MGSDALVYIFNYNKFQTDCVPEFHKLIEGQKNSPWFENHCSAMDEWIELQKYLVTRRTNIRENCEILDENFSYIGSNFTDQLFDKDFHYKNYEHLFRDIYCTTKSCPEVNCCPFHKNQSSQAIMESLNLLFQEVIGSFCLGYGQFVGRTMNPFRFHNFLSERSENEDKGLKPYLHKLGSRGIMIGYGWANCDGIHGWLTPTETLEFVDILSEIDLPRYKPSLENLQKFMDAINYISYSPSDGIKKFSSRPHSQTVKIVRTTMWDTLALSFIRTLGILALKENQGLLWGNDIWFSRKWNDSPK